MNKVAILVPTKDRLDFLIRLINYYVSINSLHPIFIGDASSHSSEELVLKTAQGKIPIYYYHWEKLNDRKTLIKLGEKARKSNLTNYCAYHGDDDFFVPESLSKCADFLDESPEYASSQGRAFSFALDKKGPYGEFEKVGIYWDINELVGVTALERLQEISSSYWIPIFSVNRINEFIIDISNGVETVLDRDFGEYVNVMTLAMRGKSKFIDCLYLARNTHNSNIHTAKHEWITGENWYPSYCELINSTSKVLSSNGNLSEVESNIKAKLAINKIISPNFYPKTSVSKWLRSSVLGYLDKKRLYKLIKFYRRVKYFLISVRFMIISKTRLPKSNYYKDVSPIINSCKKTN